MPPRAITPRSRNREILARSPTRRFPGQNLTISATLIFALVSVFAAEPEKKVTYEDDVLPILRDNCLKCHNPDKLKGDLDLTSFSAAIKGGGSGATLNASDPEGSQLYKAITHSDEPTMPPNAKLADKDIAVIRRWIEGGLLQGVNSKALAANKPAADLALKASSIGKPDGPPPLPVGLSLEPFVRATHGSALTALASSPWAPVVALAAARQIVLYHTGDLEFVGVLPFAEGLPCDLKFSRNGRLLLAGGGRGGKSGVVVVWDITTGERITTVGDEFDSVLAADISPDQQWVALGGPDRILKIYRTKDGALEHKIKKHTEWVTAVEFSPDGKYLASGDRNGGLVLWEAESGQELFSLPGHKAAITAITWRSDSAMVLSASEDGTLKLWKSADGSALRSIPAHAGGALAARFAPDGRVVSSGRDNKVQIWDSSGKNVRTLPFTGDLPNRVTFSDDGGKVIASDWNGRVFVWDAKNGKALGELDANPPPLVERVQQISGRIATLQAEAAKAAAVLPVSELDANAAQVALAETKKKLADAKAQAAKAEPEVATLLGPKIAEWEKQVVKLTALATAAGKKATDAKAHAEDTAAKLTAAKASLVRWQAVLQARSSASTAGKISAR
jgi:hypothetical protein